MSSKLGYEELEQQIIALKNAQIEDDKTKTALRESQRRLTTLMSNLPGMAYRCLNIPDWTMEFVSDGCLALTGYQPKELLENDRISYGELIHRGDREIVWKTIQAAIDKKQKFQITYRIITAQGDTKWVWEQGQSIVGSEGDFVALEGFITDITAQKRVEEKLAQSEAFLDSVINGIVDPIFVKDEEHRWIALNDSLCEMLGYSREELLGKSDYDLFPKQQAEGFWAHDDIVMSKDKPDINEEEISIGNQTHTVSTIKSPFNNPITGKRNLVGTIRDITEQKKNERELQKMQELKGLGLLAGGIAHDFNNVFMGLFGNITLAKQDLPKDHPSFGSLEEAERFMGRATRLSNQLLTFAKGGAPVIGNVNIETLAEEITRFDLSGSNVRLVFKAPKDLWMAKVDQGQMQQVFSNLAINARQAMPDGGQLYIFFENVELPADDVLKKGKYIKIIFKDEGIGIDKQDIDRIFDPYFSTKQTGSGLGLATSYSIMEKHDGHIYVNSKLGEGTTFTLYLPALESKISSPKSTHPKHDSSRSKHSMRILVMDDDEGILRLVSRILEKNGFQTETVSNGEQSIEMYQQFMKSGTPFDAVIMDLTIPGGIGGKEAVQKILASDPKAKVIVSSGYADNYVLSDFSKYGFKGFIAKPYTYNKLLEVLDQVLES